MLFRSCITTYPGRRSCRSLLTRDATLEMLFQESPIYQNIADLTAGKEYELSFVWAGGQFTDQTGPTDQHWDYTLDGTTYSTDTVTVPSKGFEGWFKVVKKFVASGNPFDLKFTAYGVGAGSLPPFLMLDSVKIVDPGTPPGTTVPGPLPVVGIGAAFALSRRLRRRALGTKTLRQSSSFLVER